MRIIINECKKILDIRIILLLCIFSALYYMEFTQIYRYPAGGQTTMSRYDIPFTAELVKEWGPKWKVKDEKQYQVKQRLRQIIPILATTKTGRRIYPIQLCLSHSLLEVFK